MIGELVALFPALYYFYYLYKEQEDVDRAHDSIPIRIHVNGIRGKTTVTRLIGSVLRPVCPTVTKTTGSEPVVIYPDGREEKINRHGQVNIKEQIDIINKAKNLNAKSIVFECMAVEPEYQKILEDKVMKSSIGIITNIRYDHQDVMGETLPDIAMSLGSTIPTNSKLVVPDNIAEKYILEEIAKQRNTTVHYAELSSVPEGYTQKFDYMNFDENVAIALKVAELLNISREDALINMLHATHDIGKGKIYTRLYDDKRIHFVNSFANNDVQSLLVMLSNVKFQNNAKKIALVNHRKDREKRTWSFIHFMCNFGFDSIFISSDNYLIEKELRVKGFKGEIITTTQDYIRRLQNLSTKNDNYWIGLANIKSEFADTVLNYFGVT